MGDSKINYEISRALMKTLPPIKEESSLSRISSSGRSPRNIKPVHVDSKHGILVQTLPPDPYNLPPSPAFEPEPVEPEDPLQREVDDVVSGYLHYARYSAKVPVKPDDWDPDETLYCPCCSDRNHENIRRKNGIHQETPGRPTSGRSEADDTGETSTPSPRQVHVPHRPTKLSGPSWIAYQPLPYAETYLNPEFNRPSYIEHYVETIKGDDKRASINAEVMESNHKFDEAMNKLRHTTHRLDPDYEEKRLSFY